MGDEKRLSGEGVDVEAGRVLTGEDRDRAGHQPYPERDHAVERQAGRRVDRPPRHRMLPSHGGALVGTRPPEIRYIAFAKSQDVSRSWYRPAGPPPPCAPVMAVLPRGQSPGTPPPPARPLPPRRFLPHPPH